jgi:3-dehydroquinate dehydratase-2
MEQALVDIQRMYPEVYFEYRQSNHEGVLIDWIQELGLLAMANEPFDGIILNAGGYTHTSVALRDAVACSQVPVIEVHISDITQREAFRHISLLTDVCQHSIIGHGIEGYQEAVDWIIKHTK